jgi:hypothetical protein
MFRNFLFKFAQISVVNSHSLNGRCGSEVNEMFGIGIFPLCSLFNHSCAPNVARKSIHSKIYIYTKAPVKAGEQLFDSYGYNNDREPDDLFLIH